MPQTIEAAQAWLAAHPDDPMAPKVKANLDAAVRARTATRPSDQRQPKSTSTISPPGTVGGAASVPTTPDEIAEDARDKTVGQPGKAIHYAAKALPALGSMGGGGISSLFGLPAGPGAVAAGAAGAGAGAGAGRYAQMYIDDALGYPHPDPESLETAKQVLKEAATNAAFQGALGATGLASGAAAPRMADGKMRDLALWWAKNQGAISPADQISAKGTQLEGVSPEILEEVANLSQGGKAAVPAAQAVAQRLRARVPIGLAAQNAGEGVPQMAQRLKGTAPAQAALNADLKNEVRTAIASDAISSSGQPVTPAAVTAARPMVKPDAIQAGFENTAGYAPTASDANALGAAGAVKDSSAQIGAGWRAVNKGRQAIADAEAQGAAGTPDAVQASALDSFASANTKRGLQRESPGLLRSAAAYSNRLRHMVVESDPWTAGAAVPKVADAARSLEAESIARGMPPIDPMLRDALQAPNNPAVARAAVQALSQWLYGNGSQPSPAAAPPQ